MDGCMDKLMIAGWMDRQFNKKMDGWMIKVKDGWMDNWVDDMFGQMDG